MTEYQFRDHERERGLMIEGTRRRYDKDAVHLRLGQRRVIVPEHQVVSTIEGFVGARLMLKTVVDIQTRILDMRELCTPTELPLLQLDLDGMGIAFGTSEITLERPS